MTCWLLLTHLSYHILAHRIKHLNLYLSDLGDFPTRVSQSENVVSLNAETAAVAVPNRLFILFFLWSNKCCHFCELVFFLSFINRHDVNHKLKTVQKIFNVLCQSADELNSFNSAMVWFIFTTKTIGFIGSLYIVCSSYSNDDFVLIIIKFLIDIVFFPVIFVAADSAVDEVDSSPGSKLFITWQKHSQRILPFVSGGSATRKDYEYTEKETRQ